MRRLIAAFGLVGMLLTAGCTEDDTPISRIKPAEQRVLPGDIASDPLADLVDEDGEPLVSALTIYTLRRYGCDADYVQELYDLSNRGRRLFPDGDSLEFACMSRVDPEKAKELEVILDKFGKPIFDNVLDLYEFVEAGGTSQYARSLAEIEIDGYRLFPTSRDIKFARVRGLTLEEAHEIDLIRDEDGNPILTEAHTILNLQRSNTPLSYIRELAAMKKPTGERMFTGEDISALSFVRKSSSFGMSAIPLEYIKGLASIQFPEGKQQFTAGMISLLWKEDGTVEYAQQLAGLTNLNGEPIFDAWDIAAFRRGNIRFNVPKIPRGLDDINKYLRQLSDSRPRGTFEYAKHMFDIKNGDGNPRYNGQEIFQLFQMGLTVDEIPPQDTEKPNAAVVLAVPKSDMFGAFPREAAINFLDRLQVGYDVDVTIAGHENQAYAATDRLPDTILYVPMGHGGAHALSLSNPDPQHSQGQYREEEGDIDMTDTEIELHLANLHPDATILLYSCLNGYGGSAADNLFGFITDHAGGRRVIAASDSFTADDVEIGRLHPLDIQIYNEEQGEDYTVVSQ